MSDREEVLHKLLDGELGADALAEDAILAKLAERIYGEDFLENMGLSRGESKRALVDTLGEEEETDLLIEVIPSPQLPPPPLEPFEHPTSKPFSDLESDSGRFLLYSGSSILLLTILNLLGAFSFLGSSCVGSGCPSAGHTKLNWLSIHKLSSGWGWSPPISEGIIGIPDVILLVLGLLLVIRWLLVRFSTS